MAGAEVVRAVALRIAGPFVLLAFRRGGLGAAAERAGFHGSAGIDDDGVHRSFLVDAGGRRISYREMRAGDSRENAQARAVEIRTREVLEWAAARLTAGDWVELERLAAERAAAVHRFWGDRDLVHRRTYCPREVTDDEWTVVRDSSDAQHAAERAMRRLVTARLRAEVSPAGEQMSLFGTG